jgi:DNA-binding NtrC family response regulator
MHNRMWCKGSHTHLAKRVAELNEAVAKYGIESSMDGQNDVPTVWFADALNIEDLPQFNNPFVPNILILDCKEALIPNPEWLSYFSDILIWKSPNLVAEKIASRFKRISTIQHAVERCPLRQLLTGCSPIWQKALYDLSEAALFSDAPILITGENGTGKELAAQWIQAISHLQDVNTKELTTVDCTQFNRELMGSELFGHVKGAFTGAIQQREGAIHKAHNGALFLDEIGEIPLELQPALLRVLQEGTYKPVGANEWKHAQFRLISATNRNLDQEQTEHRFRSDLFYRINGWHCHLPSLSERVSDIIPLATGFLREQLGRLVTLDDWVKSYLLNRCYPGNIRELKHVCTRIANRYSGAGEISLMDLPLQDMDLTTPFHGMDQSLNDVVSLAIHSGIDLKQLQQKLNDCAKSVAIDHSKGNLQEAAKLLGIHERTLQMHQAKHHKGATVSR